MRSLWLMRLANVAEDTQGMIEDLLAQERPAALAKPASLPHAQSTRLRRFGG